ncbi:NAD(P)H-hydrate dehydratase [Coraliomargarita parva]|uniref:NAD(P)H-hydrate dehydratase n=1 Tax=Coraliomargarita parva TaxID=3014050 RepID=UPI0022B2B954|nr:NAD(P)H-hydrate dehydratase [Coraliomargarita parva]
MTVSTCAYPVLNCSAASDLEAKLLPDESAQWGAMQGAGKGIAEAVLLDFEELCSPRQQLRVLALVGKGHNGGDALLACGQILADYPRARVSVVMLAAPEAMKPLALRAYKQVEGRVQLHVLDGAESEDAIKGLLEQMSDGRGFDLCLDGLLGMSFKAPLRENAAKLIRAVNAYDAIDLRAAVDLPSGKGDASDDCFFLADFCYATGVAKHVIFSGMADCGRVRLVDIGFFECKCGQLEPCDCASGTDEFILNEALLAPLRRLRSASVDKRSFGHLFVVGGSAYMPGALLMSVQAAVRSGVGLVTAFAPASIAASLSAQVPEAMWVPWPETANGTLNPRALPLLLDRVDRATAILVGPGMGKDRSTEMVAQEIVKLVDVPVILDADALRTRVVEQVVKRKSSMGPVVLTPHMGEYMRTAKLADPDYSTATLKQFCRSYKLITVLKGPITRISDGESVLFNTHGGPVLSRGGSGDLLGGLIGGNLAQTNKSVLDAVSRGVLMHGLAAERLARLRGQVAVHTTQVLDCLPEVLRQSSRRCCK